MSAFQQVVDRRGVVRIRLRLVERRALESDADGALVDAPILAHEVIRAEGSTAIELLSLRPLLVFRHRKETALLDGRAVRTNQVGHGDGLHDLTSSKPRNGATPVRAFRTER